MRNVILILNKMINGKDALDVNFFKKRSKVLITSNVHVLTSFVSTALVIGVINMKDAQVNRIFTSANNKTRNIYSSPSIK